MFLWYEDINQNFEEKVNEIAKFTGFAMNEDKMKVSKNDRCQ